MMNKSFVAVIVAASVAFCGYSYFKSNHYDYRKKDIKKWVQTSDNYLELYRDIKLQDTVAVQSFLEKILRDEVKEGSEYKGSVMDDKKSERRDRMIRTVDAQTDKIYDYLTSCCER